MQIVIIGCGKIGSETAIELASIGEEVVVIDKDEEKLEAVKDYDIVRIHGVPIDIAVLRSAGLETADVLLCISDNENMNIMAGQIAKNMFNVDQVIVRTFLPNNTPIYEQLGLTPICVTSLTVERVIETIGVYEADLRLEIFGTPIEFITIDAAPEWTGKRLWTLEEEVDAFPFAILRDGKLIMASIDLRIQEEDQLVLSRTVDAGDALAN